jgi:hypothetical protein
MEQRFFVEGVSPDRVWLRTLLEWGSFEPTKRQDKTRSRNT